MVGTERNNTIRSQIKIIKLGRTYLLTAAVAALPLGSALAASSPTLYLQDSTIVGSGDTLTITRVPDISGAGTKYYDVTIQFSVGSNGAISISVNSPQITPSPTLKIARFVAAVTLDRVPPRTFI